MYQIRPETLKAFVEDKSIKLPRFQRKSTWDDKKNFQLCISLFKEYPIGVSILSIRKNSRWLLDGRQRRNVLTQIYYDPENIYNWAKKFIGFKNTDQPNEIVEKFWTKIYEYLEEDEEDNEIIKKDTNNIENNNDSEEDLDEENLDEEKLIEQNENSDIENNGLDLLLNIIKMTHNKTKRGSGFTNPFDFSEYFEKLSYIDNSAGKEKLNSRKLKTFINGYKSYCRDENYDDYSRTSFKEFLLTNFSLGDKKREKKFEKEIATKWSAIKERILIIDRIEDLLSRSRIGIIEVDNILLTDEQKIFNIINSSGTKLTAVEILSAKPGWNQKIESPSDETKNYVKILYQKIEIPNQDIVKWDIPASFLPRIKDNNLLLKKFNSNIKTDFEKEITLGFKILAGIYQNGVKKEDLDSLSKNSDIKWNNIDLLLQELETLFKIIYSFSYFKFFSSWKISLMELLSDATALNFIVILYKDWQRKGKPVGNDTKAKQLQKNAFILFDKLIFEYITKQWRGSSDSKIAKNISFLNNESDIFSSISKDSWLRLINEIFDFNKIENDKITLELMKSLLYHFYCLKFIQGPDTQTSIEVDHIIPQSLFEISSIPDKDILKHNLFNLGLLPKSENASKSNKKLTEIKDPWLINQIKKYEFIEKSEFDKYSNINNWEELKNKRKEIFREAFDQFRDSILNN